MRGGLVGAFLVLTLYGGFHFDVFGFELTSQGGAPDIVQQSSMSSGVASSRAPQSPLSVAQPNLVPPTATPVSEVTATATATATPEPEEDDITAAEANVPTAEPEPTETPKPETTFTPEPTATPPPPTATPVPPTATPIPPSATPTVTSTVSVAVGVVITPASRSAAPAETATPLSGITLSGTANGKVTPYSNSLAGSTLGCNGYGAYDPNDATTAAVGWDLHDSVPCGTQLELCKGSTCITVVRKDTCPGCPGTHIDLSRRAFDILCGPTANDCSVTIRKK